MKSDQQEYKLQKEAKNCKNCLGWLHNCNADCCRVFRIDTAMLHKGRNNDYWFNPPRNHDYLWYMTLHGCKIREGKLFIQKNKYNITTDEKHHYFHRDCELLVNNLCKGHATGNKPDLCKDFKETNGTDTPKWFVVPTCLANYKGGEQDENDEER